MAGLRRYGHHVEAGLLHAALLDTAMALGGRLPELFAGFARSELPSPVAYPASCSPQAWAAASPLLLVRSMLGLDPDVPNGVVRLSGQVRDHDVAFRAEAIPIGTARVDIVAGDGEPTIAGLPSGVVLQTD